MDLSLKMNSFIGRVKSALIGGAKLNPKDTNMALDFIQHHAQREKIYAYAMLSIFSSTASKSDLEKFSLIMETGANNIMQNKEPFSEKDKDDIKSLFQNAGLKKEQAIKFINGFTALRGITFNDGAKNLKENKDLMEKRATLEKEKVG